MKRKTLLKMNLISIAIAFIFSIIGLGGFGQGPLLTHLSSLQLGSFDSGAAEIVDYDPLSHQLLVTNAESLTIDVIDISNPAVPVLVHQIDISAYGAGITSVSVKNGVVAAAIYANPVTDNGVVAFFQTTVPYSLLNQVTVGALPDMVVFTHDGTKVLVANEGEPDAGVDPEGTVSIIDISGGVASATVNNLTFSAYNSKREYLINKGVRFIDPAATIAQDTEPEYIAITEDDSKAYVTLQENNAVAVIDITTATIKDILPLGLKDHSKGSPELTQYFLNKEVSLPVLGTPAYEGGKPVYLGGFSGLYFDAGQSTATDYVFYTIPDRGPNADPVAKADVTPTPLKDLRPFHLPDYQGRIVKFTVNISTGVVSLNPADQIFLTRQDGVTPISGLHNLPGIDEVPVVISDPVVYPNHDYQDNNGVYYHALPYDALGGDFEGIQKDASGNFWLCDENRPAIYKFTSAGVMIDRFVPQGTAALVGGTAGDYGSETLPQVYYKRWSNRGFEGLAYDSDNNIMYAFIQSPMYNPSSITKNNSDIIRILGIDLNGNPVAEYVYLLERNREAGYSLNRTDKIGDATYIGNKRFLVLERDSSIPGSKGGKKYVYTIDLNGATNILGTALSNKMTSSGPTDLTLEMHTADDLAAVSVNPVTKIKTVNLPTLGYMPSDKSEGLALLPGGSIAVINDNDFGLAGAGVSDDISLGIIDFNNNYGLDASNSAPTVNITNHPVYGMFMSDGMRSFSMNGMNYFITTNEGDVRDEDMRVSGATLDPTVFPNAATIKQNTNTGRLVISEVDGDVDGDGDFDYLHSYGARSFTIFDQFGNLVFDSGDDFEQNTFAELPAYFNSTNNDNTSFKSRSDDKGPEPETVEMATIKGRTFAFVGLERIGGIMVYDISNPSAPEFVEYINNRDFTLPETNPATGDLGPEDIKFIDASESPDGNSYIVLSNEVSGTISIFEVDETAAMQPVTLNIFHNNDAESQLINAGSGVENYGGVHNFKGKLDIMRNTAAGNGWESIMLSSGDNFLAGPEFNASLNLPASEPYYDAVAMDMIGYDAVCIGNHDFDFGPDVLSKYIHSYSITQPPYLSANLDFSAEDTLQHLVDTGRLLSSTVINKNGNEFGVIGLTTPMLSFISSPRGVVVDPDIVTIVQNEIDAMTASGINKVILISHLQSIEEEKLLANQLNDIDIMIAGGGDELLTNDPGIALPGMTVYGPYPVIEQDVDGDDVYLVTTPGEYIYIGNLIVNFDEFGVVTSIDPLSNPVLVDNTTPDAILYNAVVQPVQEYIADLASNIIAQSEVNLDGIKNNVRTKETNESNLIADAMFWQADQLADVYNVNHPDVAIQNGGGIRNNNIIPAGNITELNTFDMCPFANFVSMVEDIPANQFKEILENAVSRVEFIDGRFAQISGFTFVWDPTGTAQIIDINGNITTPGTRVKEAILNDGTVIISNGVVVSGAPALNIATINFLATGGDQYPFAGAPYVTLGVTYQQMMYNYLVDGLNGLVENADYQINGEGRIKKVPYTDWTGTADNDWFNAANWTNGIPASATNTYVEDLAKAPVPVITGGTAVVNNLHVLVGAGLEVGATGALTTNAIFTNNGMFTITSDNTGAAGSFINTGTLAGNGLFSFNRNMTGTGTLGSVEGWHYLSTPVNGLMSEDVITGYYLNTWNETSNLWLHHDDNQAPSNIAFDNMKGWAVKQDLGFVGGTGDVVAFESNFADLHNGNFSANFTATDLVPGDLGNLNNWNLLGNPYASPIDAATMVFPAELNASVYFWNDAALSYDVWAGGVGNQYIPATQGFFVKAISDGTLTVTNAMRTHNGAGNYYKSEIENLLTLEVSGNGYQDKTYIRFEDNASTAFDREYDAFKLLSSADVPQIYTTISGTDYAINALQPVETLPMAFESNISGTFTLNAIEVSNFTEIYLEDMLTGEMVNMLEIDYPFDYVAGSSSARFVIHFGSLGVDEILPGMVTIYSANKNVYVQANDEASGIINIYSITGQKIKSEEMNPGLNLVSVDETSGFVIVEAISGSNVKSAKVFIR